MVEESGLYYQDGFGGLVVPGVPTCGYIPNGMVDKHLMQ